MTSLLQSKRKKTSMLVLVQIVYGTVFCSACVSVVFGKITLLANTAFEAIYTTSGISAADVDGDKLFEYIVAVLDGPNMILTFDRKRLVYYNAVQNQSPYEPLMDAEGRTTSTCACDLDGDGQEELYIHNANMGTGGITNPDKLYKWHASEFVNLFDQERNRHLTPKYGGHTVSCVDYNENGRYSFLVTTYSKDGKGTYLLLTMNSTDPDNNIHSGNVVIADVTEQTGLNIVRDGRGIAVGPLFGNDGKSDIIITNDNSYFLHSLTFRHEGNNAVFRNNGDGTFTDVAESIDADENGRAVTLGDFNNDGIVDIMYLNWLGPNRFLLHNNISFDKIEDDTGFTKPGPSDIMITADFDNDGNLDIIISGADKDELLPTKNKMFSFLVSQNTSATTIVANPLNNVVLENLHITGISAGDLNANGILEIFVSHRLYQSRTLSIFEMSSSYNWIRIIPKTLAGSAAKGATVLLILSDDSKHYRIIGEGCGYMCHVEPVAHFGLAYLFAREVSVQWPDGHVVQTFLHRNLANKTLVVSYTGDVEKLSSETTLAFPASNTNLLSALFVSYFSFVLLIMRVMLFNPF